MSPLSIDAILAAILQDVSNGQYQAAARRALEGLEQHVRHPDLLHLAAIALQGCGAAEKAIPFFQQAVQISPDFAAYRVNYADCLLALGQWQQAISVLQEKPQLIAENGPAQTNLGQAHELGGDYAKAAVAWKRALELQPDQSVCYLNYARAIEHTEGPATAVDFLRQAWQRFSSDAGIAITLSATMITAGQYQAAIDLLDDARQQWPDIGEIWLNRAGALQKMARYDDAKNDYKKAMTAPALLDDTMLQARISLAMLELLTGNGDQGWPLYEARLELPFPQLQPCALPRWRGQQTSAEDGLFVRGDQGFGDVLHMLRYIPLLQAKWSGPIILEVPAALATLTTLFCPDVAVIARNAALPHPCQYQVSMMSLPLVLDCLDPIPPAAEVPDIAPNPAFAGKTGLVWQGSPTHLNDANRSIPAQALARLENNQTAFLSLQLEGGDATPFAMPTAASAMTDFLASAAVVQGLDRVITVDTALAHLAGILGKECWLLLPFDPDWRWGLAGDITPLYPSMRLFRQKSPGDWDGVIDGVISALQEVS